MVQQISCKRTNADGSVVTARDLECTSAKPSTVEACNIDSPCAQWKIEYTKCSKTCGGGEGCLMSSAIPYQLKLLKRLSCYCCD